MVIGSSFENTTFDDLIAGDFPIITEDITILSGEVLTRGAVLGRVTASGKYKIVDDAQGDGTEIARAVLAQDVDASGGDELKIPVYFTGEFSTDKLTFGGGDVFGDHTDNMRALSMFQKTPQKDAP